MHISSLARRRFLARCEYGPAQRKLLLGDIRDIFAERGNASISSTELVSRLIAIARRPWGEASRPLTPYLLSCLLAPMEIRPLPISPMWRRGYRYEQFEDAFRDYLPPRSDGPKLANVPAAAPMVVGVHEGERALTNLRMRQLAEWYEDQAYRHYTPTALAAGELDVELRAILRRETGPEQVEANFNRVIRLVRRQ